MHWHHIGTGHPAAKKQKAKQDYTSKLSFGLLIPFKNHKEGLKAFSYAVTNYTSEPAPKHFTEALATLISIADKQCKPLQTDPFGIIPAWHSYDLCSQTTHFTKKAVMTTTEFSLKNVVAKRFIIHMYTQLQWEWTLCTCHQKCTQLEMLIVIVMTVVIMQCRSCPCAAHIFWTFQSCKNGCLPESKNCNDLIFQSLNMQNILDMFEGKPNAKLWNNFYNASIDVMLKWHEDKLRKRICPSKLSEAFSQLTSTPTQISTPLEVWFQSVVIVL